MSKNKQTARNEYAVENSVNEVSETVDAVEEKVAEPEVEVKMFGKVTGCKKLNIRKKPNTAADVLVVVGEGTKLLIDTNKPNADWYKVRTNDGVDGFVMKKYVALNKRKGA